MMPLLAGNSFFCKESTSKKGTTPLINVFPVRFEDDMRHLVDDLKSIYPHHYSGLHTKINKLEDDSWSWVSVYSFDFIKFFFIVYFYLLLMPSL